MGEYYMRDHEQILHNYSVYQSGWRIYGCGYKIGVYIQDDRRQFGNAT